ncbi:MAG: hypothetical protein ABIF08_02085 [Nanoarchaeota archaeon]
MQRDKSLGSIPVGIEWMLRYKGVEIPEIESFQERFSPQNGDGSNNLEKVAKRVKEKYPHVNFNILSFPRGKGKEKIDEIEKAVKKGKPVLISIGINKPFSSGIVFHTVPVVEIDEKVIKVLSMNADTIKDQLRSFDRKSIERIHNTHDDGNNILILS